MQTTTTQSTRTDPLVMVAPGVWMRESIAANYAGPIDPKHEQAAAEWIATHGTDWK